MALYRAISSYYTDILDTINIAYVKNGSSFDNAWESLDKLNLIKKMASTIIKIDRLQTTDLQYWNSQKMTFIFYIIILTIVLTIIFGVIVFFSYMKFIEYQEDKKENKGAFSEFTKSIVIYLIIFVIVFTAFYLLLFNFGFVIKQCKAQLEKNHDDFNQFKNLLTNIPNGALLDKALLYIGFIYKGSVEEAQEILIELNTQITNINNAQDSSDQSMPSVIDLQSLKSYKSLLTSINTSTINQAVLSGQLLSDIHDSLKQFFNDGKGYYNLKTNVVSASNIYTLREIRRVMNFYYFLTLKKSTDQDVKVNMDNDHLLIQELIIQPIINMSFPIILADQHNELQLINSITTSLTPYQIDLSKYTDYFIQQVEYAIATTSNGSKYIPSGAALKNVSQEDLIKAKNSIGEQTIDNPSSQATCNGDNQPNLQTIISSEQSSFIKNLYQRITTEVYIQQQTGLKAIMGLGPVDNKFYTPYQFLLNLNQIPYQDFKEGLEVQYLADIIQPFYNRISSAKDHFSLDDINYEENKSVATLLQFMSMTIAIILLIWGYYLRLWKDGYNKRADSFEKRLNDALDKGIDSHIEKVKSDNFKAILNQWIQLGIITAGTFFIISVIYSSYVKKRDVQAYNVEIIESNTSDFKDSINQVLVKLESFDRSASSEQLDYIANITCIKDQNKFDLQILLLNMIDKFEKCNYMLEAAKNKFPFPYTEITIDLFMIGVILGGMIYLTSSFKPSDKYSEIQSLKKTVKEIEMGILSPEAVKDRIKRSIDCHDVDMEKIVYALKIIFFVFIFLFLLYYSTKILSSSQAFKTGIYNSSFFDQSQCYGRS